MKANFKHAEKEIIPALCLTVERLNEILKNAQTNMMKKHPTQGSKTRFLEYIVDECKDINEVICATIEWKGMTDHMQRVALNKAEAGRASGIIQPVKGRGIIRPLG